MPYAKPNDRQETLFEEKVGWEKEWQGMPEYRQQNLLPVKSVTVNFATIEQMKQFAELIGQPITTDTRFIWFPKVSAESMKNKVYVNE